MKVFLGGTCNGTTWRDELIPSLKALDISYFNPVVEDWTPECQSMEVLEKEEFCDVHLYHITSAMEGVFSIAEAVHSAHTVGKECIFTVNKKGFTTGQLKSLRAVMDLISELGGHIHFDGDSMEHLLETLEFLQADHKLSI